MAIYLPQRREDAKFLETIIIMKFLPLIFLLLLAGVGTAQNTACDGQRYGEPVFTNVIKTTVTYAPAPNYLEVADILGDTVQLVMDVYQPEGDPAVARPVVVLAHGGSFIFGDRTMMDDDCRRLARAGFVAATVQYRLYPALVVGFPDSTAIIGAVAKAMSDMKAAVRYFREDGATDNQFKVDTNFIFVGGYSAGAVAALHVAYMDDSDDISNHVRNQINLNGGFKGSSGTASNRAYSERISAVLNRSGGLHRAHWLNSGEVPLSSIHGTADETVFYQTGLAANIAYLEGTGKIHPRAQAEGVGSQLIVVEGGDHINMYATTSPFAPQYEAYWTQCYTLLESIVCATTDVNEGQPITWAARIYPNPATQFVQLELDPALTSVEVRIVDAQGRMVRLISNYVSLTAIPVADWVPGVYQVQLLSEGKLLGVGRLVR
jgi:para-nitrobenzyl esterase